MPGRSKLTDMTDAKELGVNPFASSLRILAAEVKENKELFEAKSYTDNVFVTVGEKRDLTFLLERETYCKVYKSSSCRKVVAKLNGRATKLLMWLIYEVKPSNDFVIINIKRFKKEADVNSNNTYNSAINDLIKANLILKTNKMNVYWINPAYFFSGNRLRKYISSVSVYNSKN